MNTLLETFYLYKAIESIGQHANRFEGNHFWMLFSQLSQQASKTVDDRKLKKMGHKKQSVAEYERKVQDNSWFVCLTLFLYY